ncbi:MAG: hypothetical protein GWN13_02860, partial [Phycisphaerae bacterium]|nr:hypothetical protein [Phycisphaerae bacterium]
MADSIEEAAEKGAQKALERIGLGDECAGDDIKEIRSWLDTFRVIKRGFTQTTVRIFTAAFWVLLLGGLISYIAKKLG